MISSLEQLCDSSETLRATLAPMASKLLKWLYDKDIIGEEAIAAWGGRQPPRPALAVGPETADKPLSSFRANAEAFLIWLRDAEEESEEEEEEEAVRS